VLIVNIHADTQIRRLTSVDECKKGGVWKVLEVSDERIVLSVHESGEEKIVSASGRDEIVRHVASKEDILEAIGRIGFIRTIQAPNDKIRREFYNKAMSKMKAVKLSKRSFRPDFAIIGKFLPLERCGLLSQISLVAAMAAINNMIHKYGALDAVFSQPEYAQIPMAVVGIVMKFF
jgi:hypothetical protein